MTRDLQHWRLELERHAGRAAATHDAEAIHRTRVAARRLRTALELQGRQGLVGDLRALCAGLGPARDLHVMAGIPPLRAWARAQAAASRLEVARLLGSPRIRGLLEALRHLPGEPGPGARRVLARLERQVRRALRRRRGARGEDRAQATHLLRRRVRRLRYAREALGEATGPLAEVQEALGAFSDALALRRLVARWAEETGGDARGALARLDAALTAPPAAPAPPPRPGSPARRRARSRGDRRAPSPSSS